jgi:hypothetical protein
MPIYEYYCPDHDRIYQFFAKTLAQGRTVPGCPDNPAHRMTRIPSAFAVVGRAKEAPPTPGPGAAPGAGPEDPRMDAAMEAMEGEFSNVDENDPRAMGRMMRRMAELTGEKLGGEMEEVVRKLEEGADPESLEEQLGEGESAPGEGPEGPFAAGAGEGGTAPRVRRAPTRDPNLYDYDT